VREAQITLQAIRSLAGKDVKDALIDAETLGWQLPKASWMHLSCGTIPFAPGKVETRIVNGASQAVGSDRNRSLKGTPGSIL
jgi:hypothetical protein